jgi:hypothetical protein
MTNETGLVIAWMEDAGIRLHWVLLEPGEEVMPAIERTRIALAAPDSAILIHEDDLPPKPSRKSALIAGRRVVPSPQWRLEQWRKKVNAKMDDADRMGGPRPMREAVAATTPRVAHIEAWAKLLRELTWDGVGDEPEIPELGPFIPVSEEHKFPAGDERLSDWGDVDAEKALKSQDLLDLLGNGDGAVSDVVGKLTKGSRKRFTELLNVELAELQLDRGGPREDRKREANIERLLGIFARVGEM